jgi:hypothetical protein
MSRISDIFLLCRDTLGDLQEERYSDATLMRNLRMAIKDIAIQTNLFKMIITIPLINGHSTFKMPDGILNLSHVTYKKKDLPLRSSGWMTANREVYWRNKAVQIPEGELEFAIYDEVKRRQLSTYPRAFGDFNVQYVSEPNEYGLAAGLTVPAGDYDQLTYYGLVGEFIDSDMAEDIQTSYYGVVTAIEEGDILTIYYSRCPPLPDDVDDDFELDECFDAALKFYICGIALRNDVDTENRQMASEEFAMYQRDVDAIIQLAHVDSVSAPSFESHYNGMG